jgi:hypothetical protein
MREPKTTQKIHTKNKAKNAKTISRVRKKITTSLEINELHEDILRKIVVDGDASVGWGEGDDKERLMYGFPSDIPPLSVKAKYYIKDSTVDGIFCLKNILKGKATQFLFENLITKARITFTPYSIKDLCKKGSCIKHITDHEFETFQKNYAHGFVFKNLGNKK